MIGSMRSWLTSDTRLRIWGYVAPELRRSSATSLPAFGQKSPALRVRVLPPLGCFGGDLFGRRDSAQSHPYIPRISGIMSNQVGNAHDPPDAIVLIDHRDEESDVPPSLPEWLLSTSSVVTRCPYSPKPFIRDGQLWQASHITRPAILFRCRWRKAAIRIRNPLLLSANTFEPKQ